MLNMAVKITKIKNNITQNRPTDTNVHPRCIRIHRQDSTYMRHCSLLLSAAAAAQAAARLRAYSSDQYSAAALPIVNTWSTLIHADPR